MKIPLTTSASIVGWGLWDRSWAKSIAIKCAAPAMLCPQVNPPVCCLCVRHLLLYMQGLPEWAFVGPPLQQHCSQTHNLTLHETLLAMQVR